MAYYTDFLAPEQGGSYDMGLYAARCGWESFMSRKRLSLHLHIIFKLIGLLMMTLAVSMLPALLYGFYYRDAGRAPLMLSMGTVLFLGTVLFFFGRRKEEDLYRREAMVVVGFGWIFAGLASALPFYFSGVFPSFIDCYFEAISGLTTTGASVLTDFDAMPASLHFWRCFTHWLGGMGIIVLFVAILPFIGAGGKALMRSEVPGPVTDVLTPRVKDTALALWKLYCIFTLLETLFLILCGMNLYNALCHTFATLATGGFSTHPASIAGFESPAVETVLIFFMCVAGTNFSLYYAMMRGKRKALLRDPEWRTYIAIIVVSVLFTTIMLVLLTPGYRSNLAQAVRDASFQVVSIMTTTGFATANFDDWPTAVRFLLVFLMFVGGSAGSTGGGIKVIRWVILLKAAWAQLEKVYSPRTVRKIRIGGEALRDDLLITCLGFFLIWMLIFAGGTFLVCLLEAPFWQENYLDLVTASAAVAATLNNIGPGLGLVGAVENYAFFQPVTKLLLSFFMVLGRLELYTILVLFAPRFWGLR